jgi:hypothetical protein
VRIVFVILGVVAIAIGVILLSYSTPQYACRPGGESQVCGIINYSPYFWPGSFIAAAGIFVGIAGLEMASWKDQPDSDER